MKTLKVILFALLFGALSSPAQPLHISFSGGMSNYTGDLQSKFYNAHNNHLALGFNLKYLVNSMVAVRVGYNYGYLSASDVNNGPALRFRNLSFATNINEVNAVVEVNFFSLENIRFTPYLIGGVGLYHFNPYSLDENGRKIYLHDIGTEGQYLGVVKPYKLIQSNLISGGGFKFKLSDVVTLNYEVGLRKLNSDYVDDVSTAYYLPESSAYYHIAFRELGTSYKDRFGKMRGSPGHDDFYYFNTLGMTISIADFQYHFRKSRLTSTRNPTQF